jgi:hypothetical protein
MPFVLIAVLAILVAQAGATNLLVNGSFETGDFTGWTLGTTSNGTAGEGFPIVAQWPLNGQVNAWKGEVGQVNFNQGVFEGATLSQTFNSARGATTLSFDYAAMGGNSGNVEGGVFQLVVDGAALAAFDVTDIDAGQVINGTLSTTANLSAGQHTFEIDVLRSFITVPGETPYQYVTNADVEGTVPEPGSLILMGSGVLGLAGILRRKIGF